MQTAADHPEAPTAIRHDLGAIFISLELSRSTWLITSLSPGGGEKIDVYKRQELCRGAADDAAAAMRIWCLGASFTQKVSPFQAAYNCSHGQGPEFRGGPRPAWPPPQPAAWEKP